MRQRRAILVGFGVVMAVITLGATAYACTAVVGKVTIDNGNNTTGAGGYGTSFGDAGANGGGTGTVPGYCNTNTGNGYTNIVSTGSIPLMKITVGPSTCVVRTTAGDGTTTSGVNTLSSASASFVAADVGALLSSTVASQIPAGTSIVSVTSATQVVMSANSGANSGVGAIKITRATPGSTRTSLADGVTTSGKNTLSSNSAAFDYHDLGATLSSSVTSPSLQIPAGTTIVSVTDSKNVVMSANAGVTSTSGAITIRQLPSVNKFPVGNATVTITSGGRTGDCMFNPPDPQGSGLNPNPTILIDSSGYGSATLNLNLFQSPPGLPGTYSVCVTGGTPTVGTGVVPGNGYVNQVLIRAGII